MKRFLLLSWLFFVLMVSLIPVPETDLETTGVDKIVHFLIYGITAILFLRFFYEMATAHGFIGPLSILSAFLYGLLIEVIQNFLPYRSFSVMDIIANLAGATVFVFLYQGIKTF